MLEETQLRQPEVLSALRKIVRALSSAWDMDTALELITRETTEVMHVDCCTIYLLDPDGETLRLQASTGLAQRALGRATLGVGEGMTGHAMAHNRPVFAADAQHDPHFKWVDEAEERGFRSLLAVPLVVEDRPIGALNVQTRAAHDYTAAEVEIVSLIGDLAANFLARARLLDQQRRQIAELRTIAQVSETVTSPLYLDDMLEIVSEMAAQVVDAAVSCHIFLWDEDQGTLHRQTRPQTVAGLRLELGQGIAGRVAEAGEVIYVPDVRTAPDFAATEMARQAGYVSLLAAPLSVRDRVIGVLNTYTAAPHEFTPAERTLLMTLANQTALAIENAQLITNTAIVREMHHRIKNNLQTVAMLMQMQVYETDHVETRDALNSNIHRVNSIAMVHELLSEKGFRLVDVKDVLQRVAQTTLKSMVSPDQEIEIFIFGEALQLPSRAATALTLVVNELVSNALEHAFDGQSRGHVEISLGRSPDEFIVLVKDDGAGLPSEFKAGLGLEIAQTLAEDDLRGRLKFNRLPKGTEVSLRMPRAVQEI